MYIIIQQINWQESSSPLCLRHYLCDSVGQRLGGAGPANHRPLRTHTEVMGAVQ